MALVTVADAMKLLDIKNMPTVHYTVKEAGVTKIKKGRRTYFDKDELLEKVQKWRNEKDSKPRKKSSKKRTPAETLTKPLVAPFERDPKIVAWEKGAWRGWCFAAIEDVDEDVVKVLTDYGGQHTWVTDTLVQDLAQGKAYTMEPAQVLRFIAMQFSHVADTSLREIIPKLTALAGELDEIEAEYKEAQR